MVSAVLTPAPNAGAWVDRGSRFCIFRADEGFETYHNHPEVTHVLSFLDLTYELTLKSSDQTGEDLLPES